MKKSIKIFMVMLLMFAVSFVSGTGPAGASNVCDQKKAVNCPAQIERIWKSSIGTDKQIVSLNRVQLFDNIYEYKVIIKVGTGEFDNIGIYRVVKENASFKPVSTKKAVMMIPGDASTFDTNFLVSSDKVPADQSLAIYLAQNDIDVWGIDFRWAFVPDGTDDFTFMEEWNTQLHLNDIKLGVKTARITRALTGSGFGKIFMLGMSRGAQFVYAYANEETQIPGPFRDLKGIIPLDMIYKIDPVRIDLIQAAQARYMVYQYLYNSGVYYSADGYNTKVLGYLAMTAPDEPSEAIPGLTNKQAALFAVSATYATFVPPLEPYTPFFHYLAGVFDEYGFPVGLQFTNNDYVIDKALATPSYQSMGEIIDGEAINSDLVDVPYDDHLADINIPVFYVGSAGGYGDAGIYTTTLLGSTDVSSLVVAMYPNPPYPPQAVFVDYGHADLLWADSAETLVWLPICNWINSH